MGALGIRPSARALGAVSALAAAAVLAPAALAAPSAVSTSTATSQATSVVVARPAGLVAGDVLVAAVTARAGAAAAVAAPGGWTPVRREACAGPGGVELTQALFVRVAAPSEAPSTAWSVTAAGGVSAGVAAYRGVDVSAPVLASAGGFSRNSRGIHAPAADGAAGGVAVALFGRSGAGAIDAPAATARRFLASSAVASVLAVDAGQSAAGPTGTLVARPDAPAACNIGQTLVLRAGSASTPPPPPPPPPPAGDRTAPSAPASLRTTSVTATAVSVAWNASTDDVRVTGYGLDRDGTGLGTTPGTTATFSGLQCGRVYTFGVDAFDAAGNRSVRSTLAATTSACPSAPPPVGGKSVVLVDRPFVCNGRVDLDLVKVTMRSADADAISLAPGCTGRIGRVEVETWTQDGIKVQNQPGAAHDLVVEDGYVKGWALSPGAHQDGIQAMGGSRITFRNLRIDVVGAQNLFVNKAGAGATTPTGIVCDGCVLGPNVATPLLVNVAVGSGARNTLVCTSPRFGRAVSLSGGAVNAGNTVASVGDPRCANVTAR